ncbi:UvrD-helicase domain-containing protein [Frateuria sp. YIM B11624]|uniref:UvrD-helicase domain-containing protein n=1 Tax=Frateuria sp. YIM B11624 TaxID=3143185 RepID=UPI003C73EAAC
MENYLLVSESAADMLASSRHGRVSKVPSDSLPGLHSKTLVEDLKAYATGLERADEYRAVICVKALSELHGDADTVYARIARVLKAASMPPVHLPRSWSEYHYKNRLAFFAVGENDGDQRWLAEIDGASRTVRFLEISDSNKRILLQDWLPPAVPDSSKYMQWAATISAKVEREREGESFSDQVDLKAIGSEAVVQGYSYDYWRTLLKPEQLQIVDAPLNSSVRVIGPAGSGKTLALCMRAIRLSRDENVVGGRKKILIVTHSWAMAERIDGILLSLNDGRPLANISVLPLLYVLQYHAGNVGQGASAVLGEDSSDGQRRVIELLDRFIADVEPRLSSAAKSDMSPGIVRALNAPSGSHARNELVLDLYEEIIGVLSPQGVMPGDSDKVADYLSEARDQTMPPFVTRADREFCLRVFERFLEQLIDLGVITTDQLVLDSIRIFETFTWNVRRETDGYDFILVDELQLFDSQERLAVSLLSRAKPGMVFLSVEDPSQGLFSAVNARSEALKTQSSVYLSETHRFRAGLFELISFLYGRFPLNAAAIRVAKSEAKARKPRLVQLSSVDSVADYCVAKAQEVAASKERGRRLCVVCISETERQIFAAIKQAGIAAVRLTSFDDVELLTYQRRAAVVASWQFVGGTQFSDVVLVVSGLPRASSAYAQLRELTAIYLGASRASSALDIVCDSRIPDALQAAHKSKLLTKAALKAL